MATPKRDSERLTSHDELLREWSGTDAHTGDASRPFILDGVVDPQQWGLSSPKVHFLLKEGYAVDEACNRDTYDLRKELRGWLDDPLGDRRTWLGMSRWAYIAGLVHRGQGFESGDSDVGRKEALKSLRACSFSNIKKSNGKSSSGDNDLRAYVEVDGDRIERQVRLIKPDVVIFGSTWHLVRSNNKKWDASKNLFIEATCACGGNHGFDCPYGVYQDDGMLLIDFWHPSCRHPQYLLEIALEKAVSLGRINMGRG